MTLSNNECIGYLEILRRELVPALGCTEPICLAYAAAKAKDILGGIPTSIEVACNGNIIKNVKSVIVPNSGGLKGIQAAIAIGTAGGHPEKGLEVLTDITDEDIVYASTLLATIPITVSVLNTAAKLHVKVIAKNDRDTAFVEIIHQHTHIVLMKRNNVVLFEIPFSEHPGTENTPFGNPLSVRSIVQFAESIDIEKLSPIIEPQIFFNNAISMEGLKNNWGVSIGKNLLEFYGQSINVRAKAVAAAGSDARMSGCPFPVVINSGSGNQGLTVSLPVMEYAKELKVGNEKLIRALAISNLIAIHQKSFIGRLSAYCGAVTAASGAGAAITWLFGGTLEQIEETITNTLANISGMLCDGAKPSCAAKIASAIDAALLGHNLAMKKEYFANGDGIVKNTIEETISGIGKIASQGMVDTDREILSLMIG
ncbi:hypothetical protein SpiGrapes_0147 [Sphaerochaeta pleomorpha str. Grapes]|uniref:UPF0597 protein SpiGrapes_0147 n=1 Tax=Sphaerochaeta pleomorpha (strain ATCC BAA-1885 / DSM 22778 / Grapes) TaxID=158190 RepID=G8QTP6_SPHPG|nr:L-serine ammonia-lyase, iron-sulfur-dependent, subunit alpha [Sphaerochaeta pleomorpha]AEV28011.1 hypothetical protein SpiGrapes_0147 [Sphaerochaeta pleomorpha str. Grapes]